MKYVREYTKKDGSKVFHVSIRQQGVEIAQKFLDKDLAKKFINHTLTDIDREKVGYTKDECFETLARMYQNKVLPKHKHEIIEVRMVNKLIRDFRLLTNNKDGLLYLKDTDIANYVEDLELRLKPSSIHKRVNRIRQIYEYAIDKKKMKIKNPATDIVKPEALNDERDRRPSFDELKAIYKHGSSELWACVKIAIYTCMRKAEWINRDYSFEKKKNGTLLVLKHHKTDKYVGTRKLPINDRALKLMMRNDIPSYEALKSQWQRLMKKLNIHDLRFHDMRHEGISRLFEKGWSIHEVALVSGHKDWKMLKRYTNLRPESLLGKLN